MGILITRKPNVKVMKERSEWLKQHPEEIQKLISQLETDDISDDELEELNWITFDKKPRMVIVQTKNCNPMIQIIKNGQKQNNFQPQYSIANGLVVPTPFAEKSMLRVIIESNGTGIDVSEEEIQKSITKYRL